MNSVLRKKELQEAFQRGLSLGLKKGRIEGMITYQSRIIQNLERDNVEITKMMDSVDAEIKRGYEKIPYIFTDTRDHNTLNQFNKKNS